MATKITADRCNALKAKVKAECQRRSKTGSASGSKSVAGYAGASYDYSTTPAAGVKALAEHRDKIATPLNAINSSKVPKASGQTLISESDFATMEAFITVLEKRDPNDYTGTDCAGGCTGMCYGCSGSCYNSCSSCGGSCSSDCTDGCGGSCDDDCWTGCVSGCADSCEGSCTYMCVYECVDTCDDTCDSGCTGGCTSGCTGGCESICKDDCYGGCQVDCWMSCEDSCEGVNVGWL